MQLMGYYRHQSLATGLRPDFAKTQESRYPRADATFRHVACTDERGLSEKKTDIRADPSGLAALHPHRLDIEILPWVVDIRGFVDTKHLYAAFEYLAIPESQWKIMIENSVLASVRALAYMHKIRNSGAGRKSTMDIGDLPAACAKNCGKRRRTTTGSMEETRRRWDNLADSIRRRSRGGTGSCSTPSIPSHLKKKKARERKGEGY